MRVSQSAKSRQTSPGASADDVATLVAGNSDFVFDLYRELVASDSNLSGSNLFFSPHSISLALAMAYAGATGQTMEQMSETLNFALPLDRLHPAFNTLDLALASGSAGNSNEDFRLNVANSVWGQADHGFLIEFLDVLAESYGEMVREVDFKRDSEGARILINDWVAGETEDRIRDLIPPNAIDRYTRLVLANAIYFNAAWRYPFDERATVLRPFYELDGSESEVPMMRQQASFGYAAGEGYQAVELPYEGGQVAMTILLPDDGRFSEVEDSLDASLLTETLDGLERQPVRLTMPTFETESAFSLSDILVEMGMPNAFDDMMAEFAGIDGLSCLARDDQCLLISDVLHKAFVSVDEEGTEAAAATAVIIGTTKAVGPNAEPIDLVIDRPFLFTIRHFPTGAVLFVGRVLHP